MRALHLYSEVTAPEPVVRLSLECAARAFYGTHFKAAWWMFRAGVRNALVRAEVEVRCRWYRVRGLSEHEIERRWRS
jgi:hypothetical protein